MAPEQVTAATTLAPRPVALSSVLARERTFPLVGGLGRLFPEGGLRRGSTVLISPDRHPGATSLALALLSGPSAAGSWCAVVGGGDLGWVAAAQLGADLNQVASIPGPCPNWPTVTAALLEGVDLVLLCPGASVPGPFLARKLEARARERGSVLLVLGDGWPGSPDVRLSPASSTWHGLGDGYGYLARWQLQISATGRGASSLPRQATFTFPEEAAPGPRLCAEGPGPT